MSQRQRPGPCRFFNTPNGCRQGDRCKFSHVQRGPSSPRGSSSPLSPPARSRSQTPLPQHPTPPTKPPSGVPRGVCQFFWTSGACARSFDCVYRHVRQAGNVERHAVEEAAADDEGAVVDFFSPEGLAIGAGSLREERHNLNPSEVHNHLKDFLHDSYRFDGPGRIQGFVRVLASVNDRNKAWVRTSRVSIEGESE